TQDRQKVAAWNIKIDRMHGGDRAEAAAQSPQSYRDVRCRHAPAPLRQFRHIGMKSGIVIFGLQLYSLTPKTQRLVAHGAQTRLANSHRQPRQARREPAMEQRHGRILLGRLLWPYHPALI